MRRVTLISISALAVLLVLTLVKYQGNFPFNRPEQDVTFVNFPTDFVNLKQHIPSLEIELRYATKNNFTGKEIYDFSEAYLRKGTADKLRRVAVEVGQQGYRLKIWDAYRPHRAQFKLWEAFPDRRFVADPYNGYSVHARGCAVDLTLVDERGRELDMPSGFDDFSAKADREYSDVNPDQARNARYLEEVMVKHGFESIWYEWWHFVDCDADDYDVY